MILRWVAALFFVSCLNTAQAQVEDCSFNERTLRLEATVEELTLKLAKSLRENQRMEKAVQDAIASQRTGSAIVEGCDLATFERNRAYDDWNSCKARNWLSEGNAAKCSLNQLKRITYLTENKMKYKGCSGGIRSIIEYELQNR